MIGKFPYRNEVQCEDIDWVLPSEAHNHPVVVLEITNPPFYNHTSLMLFLTRFVRIQ